MYMHTQGEKTGNSRAAAVYKVEICICLCVYVCRCNMNYTCVCMYGCKKVLAFTTSVLALVLRNCAKEGKTEMKERKQL